MNISKVPVIETGAGNNHIYVEEDADFEMARKIIINAKVQRPSVCNAIEKLLVHKNIAEEFLPVIVKDLREYNVEIRGCEKTLKIVKDAIPATEEDWYTEYLDYIIAIKVVDSIDEAIAHINKYNTKHSEAIITKDYHKALKFLRMVDAAAVYVNASTRFTDGGEFGLGVGNRNIYSEITCKRPYGTKRINYNKICNLWRGANTRIRRTLYDTRNNWWRNDGGSNTCWNN